MANGPFVVVGGGLAAARAVSTLREEGFDGDLLVVTTEPHRPYERPPLSKDYLRGQAYRDAVFPLSEEWFTEQSVELRTHATAVGLSLDDHEIVLADGTAIPFGKLLLATGSTAVPLEVPGHDLRGVHLLRTLDDADRLSGVLLQASLEGAERLEGAARVIVVGDGWVGLETAASARELGLEVTLIGRGAHPLGELGPEIGEVYAQLHEQHEVRLHRRATVVRFTGSDGQVDGVDMADGTHVDGAIVIVGVGASPNVGLARAAGLELRPAELGGGVAVDATLRTSHPDVWAAGDIASIPSATYGRPLRVTHWGRANDSGPHAARAMLGATDPYDALPYFFSDQYDVGMEHTGWFDAPDGYDEVVVSGSIDDREAYAFWVRDGRVQAGMAFNVPERTADVERLVRSGRQVPRGELQAFVAG
ncbi:NAD(P)/FAD-dependent oxidoreductase [Xylanimonas oleitrophica]|uniref:NAD(P)/FAD-dependent oxidoreductase n=1 Tax=Xylanimonas oleitrophica TaxID=2607479 RepID=A0A2W5WNM9_9MICO|nr:FAD-dependent oxidoreductase [Xylanimonas oleitrophica]PZR52363.1 NAD(P)/FAD-dependent oxidoreductase [Xylanimonas oleitrophica]